ncbi:hypothetical protein C8F04DRAFT_100590 [Mycena alexandri]|uniref:Uncharacterized protein n=1 Tax=Mycena alexandri TaxID=1745969 RepID=A0AAD6SHK4_9AGAR|nr:hypothetical protein C8F04DRAFT_100590 [Mycena alexandri]
MDVTADIDLTREVIEIEDTDSEADLERALTKIEREFEAVVKEGFTFDGNFLFSARYSMRKAANPCLDIDGIGTVGLPVSDRDARAIIAVCEPGRRVADSQGHATPGVWEISADKIRFNDLAWNAWIEEKGIEACTALHKEPETPPNCILRKLVIHESGFQQTHFQDEAGPMETKIADLVVVLPSSFEGGQLQLRHGLETRSFNLDQNSGILTSVVAAYVGVCRALSSLTSGYRLSLVYDITRPSRGTGLPPGLPDTRGPAQKLRNILQNWTQATSNAASNTAAPEFLACLLRQTYTTKNGQNFDTGMLSGADGQLISHLTPLLDEFQFRASLAQVTLTERTSASANGNRGYGRPKYDDSESDDSIDVEEFKTDQEDEPERELRVIQVLDLSGLPIDVDLGLETYHLLNGSMTSGEPDEENFEKNDRTSATITKVYHRTVLLLWPKQNSLESKVQVGDICDYVFNALRNSKSTAPTAREKGLVHLLAQSCQRGCRDEKKLQRVVQVLIKSANRWNDAQELVRGLSACRVDERTDLLGVDGFASTYKVFDWDALKDFFEGAMKNDGSNRRRQTLLLRLRELAGEDNDAELAAWCETQQEIVLQFLSKLDAEQIPWLMELSRSRGGGFLRDVIFPQLKKQNLAKEFWLPFLQTLRDAATLIPNCPPDLVEELSVQCFAEMARTVPPFPTNKPKPRYPGDVYNVSDEVHCAPILDVIKLLLENGHAEMCSQIFLQMRDSKSRGAYKATCPPWQYYLGIAPTLIESAATAALSPVFQPFFVDVVDSMISATPRDPNTPEWHTDKSSFLFDPPELVHPSNRSPNGGRIIRGEIESYSCKS